MCQNLVVSESAPNKDRFAILFECSVVKRAGLAVVGYKFRGGEAGGGGKEKDRRHRKVVEICGCGLG